YKTVVKSIAAQCGLFASFMPKPLPEKHGSALNISICLKKNGEYIFGDSSEIMSHDGKCFISGILKRINEITAFLNPTINSYKRFGVGNAPQYVNCSSQNNSSLIRVPHSAGTPPRIELRSADSACNPYIAFKLILSAGIEGIEANDCSLYEKTDIPSKKLPICLSNALNLAEKSDFIKNNLPEIVRKNLLNYFETQVQNYNNSPDKEMFEQDYYFYYI
ncbi:MAG: glutamine synthetase, partial [Ruminococcus sp.]|nr:glutamine synthetase [Ruminococcus sp.]